MPAAAEAPVPDDAAQIADVPAAATASDDSQMRADIATRRPRAIALGISPALFDATLPTLGFSARVVRLDRGQPGATPASTANPPDFAPYLASHVDRARIGMGRGRYGALRPLLLRIEQGTGV